MATVVLKYNARNLIAKKTLDYILSLGVFEKKEYYNPFAESDNDIKEGRIYSAENADDLIKKCLK